MMTEFEILTALVILLLGVVALLQFRILQLQSSVGGQPGTTGTPSRNAGDTTRRSPAPPSSRADSPKNSSKPSKAPKKSKSRGVLPDFGGRRRKREEAEAERARAEALMAKLTPMSTMNRAGLDFAELRGSPGFRHASEMLTEAMQRHSEIMAVDFRRDIVTVRHLVDGVWHRGKTWDPELAGQAVAAIKTLAGANPDERLSRQTGRFRATQGGTTCEANMATQRSTAGEKIAIRFTRPVQFFESMGNLGIKAQSQRTLREILQDGSGIVLLSGAPSSGLRTTTEIIVKSIDRLTRDVLSIEEESRKYPQLEAIDIRTYSAAKGQDPTHVLRWIYDLNPDTILLRELVNGKTIDLLCESLGKHSRLAICTVRANSAVEALVRVATLGGNRKLLAERLACVVNQRLVRKLCNDCKERYAPDEKTVEELGFAADQHVRLCRPPGKTEMPCEVCGGLGYKGSTGAFEVLRPTRDFRELLANAPRLDALRQAALRTGMRTSRQEAMDHVFRGVTSLEELTRVMDAKAKPRPLSAASR